MGEEACGEEKAFEVSQCLSYTCALSVAASPQRGPCAGPLSQQGIRYCTQSTFNDSISTQMTPDKQGKIDQSLARAIYSPGTPLSITANTRCRKFSNY